MQELLWKSVWCPGRHQATQETAACPGISEGQQYPGLYEHSWGKLLSPLTLQSLGHYIQYWAPKTGKTLINCGEFSRCPSGYSGHWSTSSWGKGAGAGLIHHGEEMASGQGRGDSIPQHLQESVWGLGASLFTSVHNERMRYYM